jgi:NADH-quinone oxidoreductase subunit H
MVAFSTVQLSPIVGQLANEAGTGVASGQARFLWAASENFGLPAWGIVLQPLGFILFFAASFAETKRAPFDAPEGESEIIGYFVEYSGMQFGLFMISEFIEIVVLSGVLTVLFLGGWHLPFGGEWLASQPLMQEQGWLYGTILGTVFWLKVLLLIWLQLTIRWTFPRFRYDQIMTLGWKILLPAGLVNLFLSAALVLWDPSLRALAVMGLLEIGLVLALTLTRREPAGAHGGGHGALGHGHGAHGALDHGHGHAVAAHGAPAAHADDHGHAAPAPAPTH